MKIEVWEYSGNQFIININFYGVSHLLNDGLYGMASRSTLRMLYLKYLKYENR
jgi:hypothetical protein